MDPSRPTVEPASTAARAPVSDPTRDAVGDRISVVVVTWNRRERLLQTLDHLARLRARPTVHVVDNGSGDGTADAVRRRHPQVDLVRLEHNRGSSARNVGVERARTPYVAFADDDSWWAPGSLAVAAAAFDDDPALGLLAGRVLVGAEGRLDPTCAAMRRSPLARDPRHRGVPVLGFLACGAAVRRQAFREVGGFDPLLFFMGEEALLAMDLVSAGWAVRYRDDVVAHHHPPPRAESSRRRVLAARADLLTVWMRRRPGVVLRETARSARSALADPVSRQALLGALRCAPAALRRRRPVPPDVEAMLARLEGHSFTGSAGSLLRVVGSGRRTGGW